MADLFEFLRLSATQRKCSPFRLATTAGIEPATYSLGNCCSIQLSYVVMSSDHKGSFEDWQDGCLVGEYGETL